MAKISQNNIILQYSEWSSKKSANTTQTSARHAHQSKSLAINRKKLTT